MELLVSASTTVHKHGIVKLFLLLLTVSLTRSVGIDFLYPHGSGIDQVLTKGFEVSSPEVQLNVPICFFGEVYSSIFVNTNGILSFQTDIPQFINIQFPLDYPVIAPFYSNIDTRSSGYVSYRETNDSGILYRFNLNIQNSFANASEFKASSVFIATWFNVGYYSNGNDKVNTFQTAIASDGNDSYVQFIYPEGGIQWIQGQPSESGLPDARAQVGLISHDGRIFTVKGSGTDQISNIDKVSNANLPGLWMFHVGNLAEGGDIEQPDITKALEEEENIAKETCTSGYTQCHSKAKCVDLISGYCCICNDGWFGNGKTCLKDDISIRVIGKVTGTVNGEQLNQLDLHSYIVMPDGRAYTAISKIPPSIGYSLPSLNIIGRIISWIAAKRTGGVKNGYELTGGKFNHTATITFPKTSDKVQIWSQYHGLDVFDQLRLDTEIIGTIPRIPSDASASVAIIVEEFSISGKGQIQSQSDQYIKLNKDGEKIPYHVEQSFKFNEACDFDDPENITTFKMKTSKIFIKYESTERIIRYGTSSKLVPLTEEDPCLYGSTTCVENSYCVVERDSFRCVCNPGYQEIYGQNDQILCVDINECTTGTHYCDKNARCLNEEGSFTCNCNPGYVGDGRVCKVEEENDNCEGQCDINAECITKLDESYCECKDGYYGDGVECIPENNDQDCRTLKNCSPYGECSELREGEFTCECLPGYRGDGYTCEDETGQGVENSSQSSISSTTTYAPTPLSTSTERTVKKYAKQCDNGQCWCPEGYIEEKNYCLDDPNYKRDTDPDDYARPLAQCLNPQTCFCAPGYSFDNRTHSCTPPSKNIGNSEVQGGTRRKKWQCNILNNCHPQAQCILSGSGEYQCQCNVDYEGDGYECTKTNVTTSCRETDNCGDNAECVYNAESGVDVCVCQEGYVGDGYSCIEKNENGECTSNTDCGPNSDCVVSQYTQKYECICLDGYARDETGVCQPLTGTCGGGICLENAQCIYDNQYKTYYCQCNSGLVGDGITECKPQVTDCSIQNNCGLHAYCDYDLLINGYVCKCEFGYFGDGFTCTTERSCEVDPYLCDQNARCLIGPENKYICQCSDGYIGNGSYCKVAPKLEGGFLLASQEIAIFRIPYNVDRRNPGKTINIKANQFAIAIDIDCRDGRVYWSDLDERKIKSSAYDGSEFKEFLIDDIGSPEGISIDWVSRNIFWVDAKNKTVEVANLETKIRKILFTQNVINPRGITVHPYRGKIFWSDWNRRAPKIESANMDGSSRTIFLQGENVVLPNSLAIDWSTDRLCYADAGTQKIECIDIDSRTRHIIVADCKYPFGLAITQSHFYWTDWKTLKIESIDRASLSQRKSSDVPLGGFSKLYGLVAVPNQCPALSNVCQYNNGNCSPGHLCLPNGKLGRTCVCAASDICNDI